LLDELVAAVLVPAREEQAAVVLLGVGEPGTRAHALVHLYCGPEMVISVVPAVQGGCENPEVARDGPGADGTPASDVSLRVGTQEGIQSLCRSRVVKRSARLSEERRREHPMAV